MSNLVGRNAFQPTIFSSSEEGTTVLIDHQHWHWQSDRYQVWALRLALARIACNTDAYDDTSAEISTGGEC